MALKRRIAQSNSQFSKIESLESRQFLSATLVEVTIPTTPTTPVKHVKAPKPAKTPKPAKKTKTGDNSNSSNSGGEQHTSVGYQIFANGA